MERLTKLEPSDHELSQFLSSQEISIFSTPIWNEILHNGLRGKPWYFCLKKDGQIVLGLPGSLLDFKLVKLFHANIPYGEFIGDLKRIPTFLDLMEDHLKKEGVHLIRIAQLGNETSNYLKGYNPIKGYQHVLDLNGLRSEMLLSKYKPAIQRNIRKALKSEVDVEEIKTKEELDDLYRLYLDTMKRNHSAPVWTKRILQAIYDAFVLSGQASIIFAKWKGKIIAGMILIHSENMSAYFLGASETGSHSLRPNDLLFHTAILKSLDGGKRSFDFMTCSELDEELIRFKEKWGAKRTPFFIYEKELDCFRVEIWRKLWKIANSRLGSTIIGSFITRFR
jgi:lipid II:glycine glycyltransferase (peptidoglycan interpeptide bridge formation enzyme)